METEKHIEMEKKTDEYGVASESLNRTICVTLKSILRADEDRLYFIASPNSSKKRATEGVSESMGTIRIADRILTMWAFKGMYGVLSSVTPRKDQVAAV